jgi:hypothetical protein
MYHVIERLEWVLLEDLGFGVCQLGSSYECAKQHPPRVSEGGTGIKRPSCKDSQGLWETEGCALGK